MPHLQRHGMLRFGRGVVAGLQTGQPVQAEVARATQGDPVAELQIELAARRCKIHMRPLAQDLPVERPSERPVDRRRAGFDSQWLRDRHRQPIALGRESASDNTQPEAAAGQHGNILQEARPCAMHPGEADAALAKRLEARRQLGTTGEAEKGGGRSFGQAQSAAATGVEHAPLLLELPELHSEPPAVIHDPEELAEHDGLVAGAIVFLSASPCSPKADTQGPALGQAMRQGDAVAAVRKGQVWRGQHTAREQTGSSAGLVGLKAELTLKAPAVSNGEPAALPQPGAQREGLVETALDFAL